MFQPVPGVPAAPPASGLVVSAARPDIARWERGLAWVPERCGTSYRLTAWCDDTANYTPPRAGSAYYEPVTLDVADECSTLGGPVDVERVRRVAEAQFPFAVARELWSGELAAASPFDVRGTPAANAYLASADADVVGASAATARVGMGRLEQAAMEATHGQPVMLHVPVLLLAQLDGYVRPVGQTLVTLAGNLLVADAGYRGTGPAGQTVGATAWAYATPPVAVLASPWVINPDDQADVDRATNTRTTWASRQFAATFDPCVHLATEITI